MTKATIKDIQLFRKLVSISSSMSNKLTPDSIEGCIIFSIKDDLLTLTSGMSGSHLCKLTMDVSSSQNGEFSISAKSIQSLVKAVSTDSIILSTSNNQLNVTAPALGTLSETLYDGDSLSKSLLDIQDAVNKYPIEDNSTLTSNLRLVSSFAGNRLVGFYGNEAYTEVISSNDLGYIRARDLASSEDFTFYLDSLLMSSVSQLGEVISIGVGKGVAEFKSDLGSLWFYTREDSDEEYEDLQQVLSLTPSSSTKVESSLFNSALNWQCFGSNDLDSVFISIDKNDKLSISGKGTKPSSLATASKDNEMEGVRLNASALRKSISSLNKSELITIDQRVVRAGNVSVKITSFTPDEKNSGYITTVMYEQVSA